METDDVAEDTASVDDHDAQPGFCVECKDQPVTIVSYHRSPCRRILNIRNRLLYTATTATSHFVKCALVKIDSSLQVAMSLTIGSG